jgi:hypothetical protein
LLSLRFNADNDGDDDNDENEMVTMTAPPTTEEEAVLRQIILVSFLELSCLGSDEERSFSVKP